MSRAIPVLCWHKVSPRLEPGITVVSPARFQRQLEVLATDGWRSIAAPDYVARQGRMGADERLCLITFDDAYACVEEHAAPLMDRLGLQAVLFPVLGCIGGDNRWDRGLLGRRFEHMSGDAIERRLDHGWTLGLHGRSHRPLKGCGLETLDTELVEARAELECLFGQNVHLLAWPFGLCDRRSVRVAQAAGIRMAFGRCADEHPFCSRRSMVYPLHDEVAIRRMLAGAAEDRLQKLAGLGARLSASLHWKS